MAFDRSTAMGSGTTRSPPKSQKESRKGHYRWDLSCFDVQKDTVRFGRTNKPKLTAVWTTCKLCRFKSLGCRSYGVKTKVGNSPSWSGRVKHVENIHYLLYPKDLKESLAHPKANWDSLEEIKVRKSAIDTRF